MSRWKDGAGWLTWGAPVPRQPSRRRRKRGIHTRGGHTKTRGADLRRWGGLYDEVGGVGIGMVCGKGKGRDAKQEKEGTGANGKIVGLEVTAEEREA